MDAGARGEALAPQDAIRGEPGELIVWEVRVASSAKYHAGISKAQPSAPHTQIRRVDQADRVVFLSGILLFMGRPFWVALLFGDRAAPRYSAPVDSRHAYRLGP